ncbi:MRG-domain-containing protein [Tothia fuscella]|uniref:Chromatin modification-related protein EAF3 n=1 Tax=Tothia fuscella TaxID=1048955 RepID=A0A9P4NV62_9PEZI|nr:MRG-domain-containing protein [Tothia fuscella]
MAPPQIFEKDEKVLCFHLELLYEAKVLGCKQQDPTDKKSPWMYLIHYKGWKNTWDDWALEGRILKFNDENIELSRNLKKEMDRVNQLSKPQKTVSAKRKGAVSGRGSEERNSTPAAAASKKRGRDNDTEKEDTYHSRPIIRIPMPDLLKSALVDDWEMVTKNNQLVKLPSDTPASVVLDDYLAYEKTKRHPGTAEVDILEEIVKGLKDYFGCAIGRVLLYRQERAQHISLLKASRSPTGDLAGKSMEDIYGAEHLIRLLVSMPELVAQTNMDMQSVNRLREEMIKLTMWLAAPQQIAKYLSVNYVNT